MNECISFSLLFLLGPIAVENVLCLVFRKKIYTHAFSVYTALGVCTC